MDSKALLEEIGKYARTFKAFSEAEQVLEGIVSLEQYGREIAGRIEVLKAEEQDLSDAKDAALKATGDAKEQAGDLVRDAKGMAETIIREAEDKARAAAEDLIASAKAEASVISASLEEKESALKSLAEAVSSKSSELETLTANLAAAKEQAKRLLGG